MPCLLQEVCIPSLTLVPSIPGRAKHCVAKPAGPVSLFPSHKSPWSSAPLVQKSVEHLHPTQHAGVQQDLLNTEHPSLLSLLQCPGAQWAAPPCAHMPGPWSHLQERQDVCCWDFALASPFLWEPGHSDSPSVLYLNSDARTACRKRLVCYLTSPSPSLGWVWVAGLQPLPNLHHTKIGSSRWLCCPGNKLGSS